MASEPSPREADFPAAFSFFSLNGTPRRSATHRQGRRSRNGLSTVVLALRRHYATEVGVPIVYRGRELDTGYRIDLVVDERVAVEAKRVSKLEEIHEAQLLTYLKHSGYEVGLLLNFNTVVLTRGGIRRLVWGWRVPRLGGPPALDPEAGQRPKVDSEAPQDKFR